MMRSLVAFVAVAVWVGGCSQPAPAPPPSGSGERSTAERTAPPSGEPGQERTPSLAEIPESLRHDAFRYSGLSSSKPLKLKVTTSSGAEPQAGEQITKLKSVGQSTALFDIERTGALAGLGSETQSLETTGVYLLSSTLGDTGGKTLALPSDLPIGKRWTVTSRLEQPGGTKMEYDAVYEVVRREKVVTEGGTFDGLLVKSSGKGRMNEQPIRMETRAWFVRDVGQVKLEVKTTMADGTSQSVTMELAK